MREFPQTAKTALARERAAILHVNHHFGGGTAVHVDRLVDFLGPHATNWLLESTPEPGVVSLRRCGIPASDRQFFRLPAEGPELVSRLRDAGIGLVHLHQLFALPPTIRPLVERLGCPFYFTVHDYHTLCARVHLKDWENLYCGELGESQCNRCMAVPPDPPDPAAPEVTEIGAYRRHFAWVFERAEAVLCPTDDVWQRIRRYQPGARAIRCGHHWLEETAPPLPPPRVAPAEGKLRIGVLGNVNAFKGAPLVNDVADRAAEEGAPVEFVVIGSLETARSRASSCRVTGSYAPEALPGLLRREAPHLIWFPVRLPETFSYTLSETLSAGLPLVAPNLGCFPERVAGRPWTWVRPWNATPDAWLAFFCALHENHFRTGTPPEPAPPRPAAAPDRNFYLDDYLRPFTR